MINTKNICLLIAIFIFISFSGVASADENNSVAVQTLYAGQHIEAGTVNVSNDSEYIYITFETTDDWVILETHLEVANSSAAIPTTKSGNAIPGQFTYKNASHPEGITIDKYQIPLETYYPLENDSLYIAAQAVVSNGETEEGAWANGTKFNEKNWATYFTYKTSDSNEDNTGGIAQEDEGTDDDGTGDEGTGDERPKSKSGGSAFSSSYLTETESSDEDNRIFSTPDLEEEPEPEMSTTNPVAVPVEQEPVASTYNMLKNGLWYIIWLLLTAICVMSGYGLTQP